MATQPLVRDVLLRDGSTLRLRAPGPEDLDDLKASYDRLSPESRYLPLHGYERTDAAATNVTQTRVGEDGGRRHSPAPPPRPPSRPQPRRRG